MAKLYESKTEQTLAEIRASHTRATQQMKQAAVQLGDQGVRAVQLWVQGAALVDEDTRTADGLAFAADAQADYAAVRAKLVAGIDAYAAGTGMTRKQILDDLADEPATNFG